MTRFTRGLAAAAVVACAFSQAACSTMLKGIPDADRAAVLKGASEHIGQCKRHYWGNTGLGAQVGFDINCDQPADQAAQAAAIAQAVKAAVQEAVAQALAGAAPPPAESP